MPNLRPAKFAGFTILVLLVLSNLVLPAGAHVTSRLSHLQGHLDPRYVNTGEMAANANLLDGQDSSAFLGVNAKAADANLLDGQNSTAFLGANAKAADADLLDGQNSSAFMAGPGKVIEGAATVAVNSSNFVLTEAGFFAVEYQCSASPNPGFVVFHNLTSASVTDLFIDDGSGANPQYWDSTPNSSVSNPAAPAGDFYTFQAQAPNVGVATIHVTSRNPGGNCDVQAQAVISS